MEETKVLELVNEVFLYSELTPQDQVAVAKSIQIGFQILGGDRCWSMKKLNNAAFKGFTTVNSTKLLYKNQDARKLLLALSNRFWSEDKPIVVRQGQCMYAHCLNPAHYYWGTRSDVSFENAQKTHTRISAEAVVKMRLEREAGGSVLGISRKYKIPYHIARRICSGETYVNVEPDQDSASLNKLWTEINTVCGIVVNRYPQEVKGFNFDYHMTNELECPWHRKGTAGHKGNFGLMGECLDCMAEIRAGRCVVDVKNFDYSWYWQVKRFWEQVKVGGSDECWPWVGATRRGNSESIAYFPSPFHSAKTQSASRVAFWLSRGYTGKYRVFSKNDCQPFCCNPAHLTIRELNGVPQPTKVTEVCLNHGNIFEHYRETNVQEEPSTALKLPPA